jgi:uncharacterized protein (UPF0248 family)
MTTAKEWLKRIKWDENLNEEDFTFTYIDFGKEREKPYSDIMKIDGNFMVFVQDGKVAEVPVHRIRKIKEKGKVVFERRIERKG